MAHRGCVSYRRTDTSPAGLTYDRSPEATALRSSSSSSSIASARLLVSATSIRARMRSQTDELSEIGTWRAYDQRDACMYPAGLWVTSVAERHCAVVTDPLPELDAAAHL